jgi:3-hydroxymyristoyl/3-hydroxydecanoyl-(acyl carrier protein) dehydratase
MIQPQLQFQFDFATSNAAASSITAYCHIDPNLEYFNGHFPNNPILPAVGIIDISLEAIRRLRNVSAVRLLEIPSTRFLNPVKPNDRLRLELSEKEPGSWSVEWHLEPQQKIAAKLSLRTAYS